MPDLPILLRSPPHMLSGLALVDSGATIGVLPYSLGVQIGFDWSPQNLQIRLTGSLAQVEARGIAVEAIVGQLAAVRLVLAWAASDQVPFVLGQFNFFQLFDVSFFRSRVLRDSSGVFFRNTLKRNPVRFFSTICGYTLIVFKGG